jgi:hypothetical protein
VEELLWVKNSRQGIRRAFTLFGPKLEKVLVKRSFSEEWGRLHKWYQSGNIFAFCSREEIHHAAQKRKAVT